VWTGAQSNFGMLFLSDDAQQGRLDFIQCVLNYKYVELLSLPSVGGGGGVNHFRVVFSLPR